MEAGDSDILAWGLLKGFIAIIIAQILFCLAVLSILGYV